MKTRGRCTGFNIKSRKAHATYRDAIAGAQIAGLNEGCGNGDPHRTLASFDGKDGTCGFNQPGKHLSLI
jgi:hypothetical protein